jgi:hypothetical protein
MPETGGQWTVLLRAVGLALAFDLVLILCCSLCASSDEEGLILRWMRCAADHPLRTGLAFTLGLIALLWPTRRRSTPSPRLPW